MDNDLISRARAFLGEPEWPADVAGFERDLSRALHIIGDLVDALELQAVQRDELESRLAEIDAQEPVAHLKRGSVIWGGMGYVGQVRIEPVAGTSEWKRGPTQDVPLYTRPAAPQPVKEGTK